MQNVNKTVTRRILEKKKTSVWYDIVKNEKRNADTFSCSNIEIQNKIWKNIFVSMYSECGIRSMKNRRKKEIVL